MKNQKGIFLNNIVSKIFERILLQRKRRMVKRHMSAYQCGGKKGRSATDHLIQLRAMIDEYRYKKRDIHISYGDLQKCFDKLLLKYSIVEFWKTGMNAKEINHVFEIGGLLFSV